MTVKLKHRPVEDKILLTVTALAILVILPFLIGSIQSQETTAIIIDLSAVLGSSIIFSGVWFSNNTKFYSSVLAVFMQALVLVALKVEGASLLYWVFPIVIATFYLLSPIAAILCNSLFITLACFLSYQQFDNFTLHRVIGALVLTNMFACALSMFMQTKNRQLSEQDKINKVRNNILELIASSSKLSKVLPAVIKGIEHEYPNAMCSILLLDKTGKHLTLGAAPSLPDFYNEAVEGFAIG